MATYHNSQTITEKTEDKQQYISIVTLFLIVTNIAHFLTLQFFLNYLNLFAGKVTSIDSVSNAIIQVMSYTGEMFLPFFDMLNKNYVGNSQVFANTYSYTVIALFVLQLVTAVGLALRSKISWYYQFSINALLVITNIWLTIQPGFYPRNIGMIVWPLFIIFLLWEGSTLRFVKLKPSLKLLQFSILYTIIVALVIFGGTLLLQGLLGK